MDYNRTIMLDADTPKTRRRMRLLAVIIAALPCYFAGFVCLSFAPNPRAVTATPTVTITGTIDPLTATVSGTPLILTPSITFTPSITPTPTTTYTATITFTPFQPSTNTPTSTPTATPTLIPSNTPTFTPSFTPTATLIPSATPTATPTFTPTSTLTASPTAFGSP